RGSDLWIDQVPITLRAKAALELPHADAERVTCIEKAGAFARRQLEHRVQCFARGDQALPHAQLESQCRLRRDGALGEASDMRGERKQHRIPENLRVADCEQVVQLEAPLRANREVQLFKEGGHVALV